MVIPSRRERNNDFAFKRKNLQRPLTISFQKTKSSTRLRDSKKQAIRCVCKIKIVYNASKQFIPRLILRKKCISLWF